MNVGILGSGDVAQKLAVGFTEPGDEVALGTRDPAKLDEFALSHAGTRAVSTAQAAAFGELLVVAMLGTATAALLEMIDPEAFANKVAGFEDSLGERVQRVLPGARDLAKKFGWEPADIGGTSSARYLEAMCMTWVLYGQITGASHYAFKMPR